MPAQTYSHGVSSFRMWEGIFQRIDVCHLQRNPQWRLATGTAWESGRESVVSRVKYIYRRQFSTTFQPRQKVSDRRPMRFWGGGGLLRKQLALHHQVMARWHHWSGDRGVAPGDRWLRGDTSSHFLCTPQTRTQTKYLWNFRGYPRSRAWWWRSRWRSTLLAFIFTPALHLSWCPSRKGARQSNTPPAVCGWTNAAEPWALQMQECRLNTGPASSDAGPVFNQRSWLEGLYAKSVRRGYSGKLSGSILAEDDCQHPRRRRWSAAVVAGLSLFHL